MRLCAAQRGEGSQGAEVADEITFQNDPAELDWDGAREWRPPA
jgi:hypothetical protein